MAHHKVEAVRTRFVALPKRQRRRLAGVGLALTIWLLLFIATEDRNDAIEGLDWFLGVAEFLLVPASLLWLVAAWAQLKVRGVRGPAVLALLLAFTVAQPFGVIATRQEAAPQPPTDAENGESVHVARLFGIPVLPFRVYNRGQPRFMPQGENAPTGTMRARSWFWLPTLTNATKIAEACASDVTVPCWAPGPPPYGQNLTVFRGGGKQWATIGNPHGRGSAPGPIPGSFTWELSAGIASPAGLAYWVLATVLVLTARRRRPRSSSPT